MRSQKLRHNWGTELKAVSLSWTIPNLPPRVDSQLRDMKNAPGVPWGSPAEVTKPGIGQGCIIPSRGLAIQGSPWASRLQGGHNVFTCFMPMQTLNIQTGYEICMQSYCDLMKETEPAQSLSAPDATLDLSFSPPGRCEVQARRLSTASAAWEAPQSWLA